MLADILLSTAMICSTLSLAGTTAFRRAHSHLSDGRVDRALKAYLLLHRISRVVTPWRAPTLACLGYCHVMCGDPYEAIRYLDEALGEKTLPRRGEWIPITLSYKAIALGALGEFDAASAILAEVCASSTLKPRTRAALVAQRAANDISAGRYAEAELALNEILRMDIDPGLRAWAHTLVALSRSYRGAMAGAVSATEEALEALQGTRAYSLAWVLSALAPILLSCGKEGEAYALEERIVPFCKSENPVTKALASCALAELALSRSDYARARNYAEEATALVPFSSIIARSLLVQAQVFQALHNSNRAMALCERILEMKASVYHRLRARELICEIGRPRLEEVAE